MGQLEGKIAVVTGATSGIGERIAERFVAEGARVVAVGRRVDEGKALETRCGPALSFIRTDVAEDKEVQAMIDQTVAKFGRLDCLINNAGTGAPMVSIADETEERFNNVFAVNVTGVMFCIKYAAPVMLRQRSGSIVTIGSGAGLRGGFSSHAYSASKAAAIHLTRSAAAELSQSGVRLNSISPGGIVTGIFAKAAGVTGTDADRVLDVVAKCFATLQPLPRAGVTDDIASAAVFLASDASSFITGQDLAVCGGLMPFGKGGWNEAVELRAELSRQIKTELAKDG